MVAKGLTRPILRSEGVYDFLITFHISSLFGIHTVFQIEKVYLFSLLIHIVYNNFNKILQITLMIKTNTVNGKCN